MEDWQQRVVDEKNVLADRIDKLEVFLESRAYDKLDEQNQSLLREQFVYMYAYLQTLVKRIRLWQK